MIRRILAGMLVVTVASLTVPVSAAAENVAQKPASTVSLTKAIAKEAVTQAKAQQPQQQQAPAAGGGGGLGRGAKIGIGLALVVGAIAAGAAIASGPEPRQWP